MDVVQGLLEGAQALVGYQPLRKGLDYAVGALLPRQGLQLAYHLIGDEAVLEVLGAGIDSRHCPGSRSYRRHFVNLGMDHIELAVEGRRLAEDYVFLADLYLVGHPFHSLEENQVDGAGVVAQRGDKSLAPLGSDCPQVADDSPQLDIGARGIYLADGVETRTVHIAEREKVDQVAEREDSELLAEQFRTPWTN